MAKHTNLNKAKDAKNDEFYTQLTDVSKELMHYKKHFKDKIVLCNCDNPTWSAFWKYFHLNFSALGLKKLISTHYDKNEPTYKMEYTGGDDNDIEVGIKTPLEGNGDFRSDECIKLLKEADIIVTNPPFSLFVDYVDLLIKYDKKFIILGNNNAITYKGMFNLIKSNKVWLGYSSNKTFVFRVGEGYKYDEKITAKMNDGYKYGKVPAISWYTNLDIDIRHDELPLTKNYKGNEQNYPKYETFDGIDVSDVKNIPKDYDGIMGVPKTIMSSFCADQFEIIGYEREDENIQCGIKNMPESFLNTYRSQGGTGHCTKGMKMLCFYDAKGNAKIPFSRILIRRKKVS